MKQIKKKFTIFQSFKYNSIKTYIYPNLKVSFYGER